MHNRDDLVLIDARNFSQGMYISSGIYVTLQGNLVLLCINCDLTKELADKITDFELEGADLYVNIEFYNTLAKQKNFVPATRKKTQLESNYEDILADFGKSLERVKHSNIIDKATTQKVVKSVDQTIKNSDASLILQCVSAIRDNNKYLYHHSVNVSILNGLMAKWLKLPQEDLEDLVNIGLLHDLGKLQIPSEILDKPEKLTPDEFELIKKHPLISWEILKNSGIHNERITTAVRGHHEKLNGSGYPDGLRMDDISFFSKITAISDIYDAMVATRSYKTALSPFEVLAQFSNEKFTHLDNRLVNIFVENMVQELVGKRVFLSSCELAVVQYIDRNDMAYPIVRIGDITMKTNDNIKCLSLYDNFIQ